MKDRADIDAVLGKLPADLVDSKYPSMTYEQGIEEALMWVLGELDDQDFSYASDE